MKSFKLVCCALLAISLLIMLGQKFLSPTPDEWKGNYRSLDFAELREKLGQPNWTQGVYKNAEGRFSAIDLDTDVSGENTQLFGDVWMHGTEIFGCFIYPRFLIAEYPSIRATGTQSDETTIISVQKHLVFCPFEKRHFRPDLGSIGRKG